MAAFFIKSGSAIIENMSVLFAIGVAYGMSKDKNGTAALTGFVDFLVVTALCALVAAPAAVKPVVISLISPITGEVVPLDKVPDEAFASHAGKP